VKGNNLLKLTWHVSAKRFPPSNFHAILPCYCEAGCPLLQTARIGRASAKAEVRGPRNVFCEIFTALFTSAKAKGVALAELNQCKFPTHLHGDIATLRQSLNL
jgi:hypothetical protein